MSMAEAQAQACLLPLVLRQWASLEDAKRDINLYALQGKFLFTIRSSSSYADGSTKLVQFVCDKSGKPRTRKSAGYNQDFDESDFKPQSSRSRKSKRCECPCRLTIKRIGEVEEVWKVTDYCLEHNDHDFYDESYLHEKLSKKPSVSTSSSVKQKKKMLAHSLVADLEDAVKVLVAKPDLFAAAEPHLTEVYRLAFPQLLEKRDWMIGDNEDVNHHSTSSSSFSSSKNSNNVNMHVSHLMHNDDIIARMASSSMHMHYDSSSDDMDHALHSTTSSNSDDILPYKQKKQRI
jgi:hypothetical protein